MSQRKTQNSQRAATVGEALAALTQRLTPVPGPSNAPRVSPIPSDYVVESVEDDTEENPQGTGAQSDHNGDQEQDRDLDNDQAPTRGASAPPPESALARSLELLASKIAAIPDNPKPSSSVKTRVPDVFDGSDPNKLETFTFQCSMYLASCKRNFPDDESRVTFVLSYLKGNPLDWFQNEINHALNNGSDEQGFQSRV